MCKETSRLVISTMNRNLLISVFLTLSTLCHCYESLGLDANRYSTHGNHTLRRFRRQTNRCKTDTLKFQCETNPECIDDEQLCDGKEDCPDGSDEKQTLCKVITCPGYLFQCEYGACISSDLQCNGKKDCKDNSDETGCPSLFERVNTNCRSDEFECNNGQCIETDGRCNGVAECEDKTDETEELCLNIECPAYTYKCKYGACVDGTAECNGIQECFDNSDEDSAACGPVTPVTETPPVGPPVTGHGKKCMTPNQPENGKWLHFIDNAQPALPNVAVQPKSQIFFKCNDMFQLTSSRDRDEELIYCREDGQWSVTKFPECQKLCPKYRNQNHAILQCKSVDGSTIPCDRATQGSSLTYKCDNYYEPEEHSLKNYCRDGTWVYNQPKCIEVCGEKQVSAQTLVVNGKVVKRGHYPWVSALYSNRPALTNSDDPSVFINICGGSLLTTSVVLTAAHCVSVQNSGEPYGAKFFRVAAGKYFNKYMDTRDNDTAQYLRVKKILMHEDYRGQDQNFRSDIALLKLEASFVLSKVVQPVCYNRLPRLGQSGTATVIGWGYTTSSGKPSDDLMEINLDYVDNERCYAEFDRDFAKQYIISDKLCAGFLNKSMGVCKGDSGGGLVVENQNQRFFVQGVVSLAYSFLGNNEVHCDIQKRALFTRVDKYLEWIQDHIHLL